MAELLGGRLGVDSLEIRVATVLRKVCGVTQPSPVSCRIWRQRRSRLVTWCRAVPGGEHGVVLVLFGSGVPATEHGDGEVGEDDGPYAGVGLGVGFR